MRNSNPLLPPKKVSGKGVLAPESRSIGHFDPNFYQKNFRQKCVVLLVESYERKMNTFYEKVIEL